MDVCCFNRPFDEQTQIRIKLEAEAILAILQACADSQCDLLGSDVIDLEIRRTRNPDRLRNINALRNMAISRVSLDANIQSRARTLQQYGFKLFDALHLVSAESGNAAVFLTTDDRLLRNAARHEAKITIRVCNPVDWAMEVFK